MYIIKKYKYKKLSKLILIHYTYFIYFYILIPNKIF